MLFQQTNVPIGPGCDVLADAFLGWSYRSFFRRYKYKLVWIKRPIVVSWVLINIHQKGCDVINHCRSSRFTLSFFIF